MKHRVSVHQARRGGGGDRVVTGLRREYIGAPRVVHSSGHTNAVIAVLTNECRRKKAVFASPSYALRNVLCNKAITIVKAGTWKTLASMSVFGL